MKSNGRVLWQGKSELNGDDIVVIGVGAIRKSQNEKTNDMFQIYFLNANTHPYEATKSDEDISVCGDCPLKPSKQGVCYVQLGKGPSKVWQCWKRGGYPHINDESWDTFHRAKPHRLGAYGDPAAAPYEIVSQWLSDNGWTGYTHQWRTCDQRFKGVVMASCESKEDAELATSMGWIPFLTVSDYDEMPNGFLRCLNDTPKQLACADCKLCCGTSSKLSKRYKGIAIKVHGKGKGNFKPTHTELIAKFSMYKGGQQC